MKKLLMIVVLISSASLGFAHEGTQYGRAGEKAFRMYRDLEVGISFFHGTWKEALKKSNRENKLIFLDAYAAWCGPCKLMAKNTFTDGSVGDFFNKNFINVKMDMERSSDGPRLSKKFALTAYPSLYFVDKNEEIVHFSLGYQQPKQLIVIGKKALKY